MTFAELLYNIQVWLYDIQDGYITHPNLPDANNRRKYAYARLCVHLPFISWFSAFLTSICPYMDGGTQQAVRVAGYWQFVTDTYDIHRYEQDMLTWVSHEEICTCEYLGEKYKQISTYLNGTKIFFSGESVNITWISCQYPWISRQYLWISCQYPVNMFKYPLLGGKNFLYSRDLNMIFTGYSRYDQIFTICSCEYVKIIFKHDTHGIFTIWSDIHDMLMWIC